MRCTLTCCTCVLSADSKWMESGCQRAFRNSSQGFKLPIKSIILQSRDMAKQEKHAGVTSPRSPLSFWKERVSGPAGFSSAMEVSLASIAEGAQRAGEPRPFHGLWIFSPELFQNSQFLFNKYTAYTQELRVKRVAKCGWRKETHSSPLLLLRHGMVAAS